MSFRRSFRSCGNKGDIPKECDTTSNPSCTKEVKVYIVAASVKYSKLQ